MRPMRLLCETVALMVAMIAGVAVSMAAVVLDCAVWFASLMGGLVCFGLAMLLLTTVTVIDHRLSFRRTAVVSPGLQLGRLGYGVAAATALASLLIGWPWWLIAGCVAGWAAMALAAWVLIRTEDRRAREKVQRWRQIRRLGRGLDPDTQIKGLHHAQARPDDRNPSGV